VTLARILPAALLALALSAASAASPITAIAQEETPAAGETPAAATSQARLVVEPTIDGDTVTAVVNVADVTNLGAFAFSLVFDPDKVEFERAEIGTFLEESGREKVCPDPAASADVVRISCVTLRPEPAGPDGTGTLATIYFRRAGRGDAEFTLENYRLVDPHATPIEATAEAGSVDLPDDRGFFEKYWVWLAIGGGVIAAIVVVGGLAAAASGRRQRPHLQSDTSQDL